MSVSHPLLKELKGHILDLMKFSEITEVRDHSPGLMPLCQTLENIFRTGFKGVTGSSFGRIKQDYWAWIEQIYNNRERHKVPFALADAIESVLDCKKVFTVVGRGRLLIRTALSRKLLMTLLACLQEDELLSKNFYDQQTSILGNEILAEILSSLLHEVNKIDFKLELQNASFLDETWELGVYKKYEFVPCKEMGITFGYIKGRAIVVKVEEGSVAAEENQIEPGDVLDELYGRSLYRCRRGLVSSLAYQFQGLPVYLSVVKSTSINGGIYTPLLSLLEKLGLRKLLERKLCLKDQGDVSPSHFPTFKESLSPDFGIFLLGCVPVGREGRLAQIENAIAKATSSTEEKKSVMLELTETKLKIHDKNTGEVVVDKHFTEISACGRKDCYPNLFAVIIGDTTCTIASDFVCYVLEATTPEEAKLILSSIGQGFGRTHWAV